MTCSTGEHSCEWAAFGSQIDAILAASAAGASHEDTSATFGISKSLLRRILRAHTPPARDRSRGCAPLDLHTCAWADSGMPVDDILDESVRGAALHQLAERFPYPVPMLAKLIGDHSAGGSPGSCGHHTCLWSDQPIVVNRILHTYNEGASLRWIADRYLYARATITRMVDAHGVVRRSASEQTIRVPLDLRDVDRRHVAGASLRVLAEERGLSRQALGRRLGRYRASHPQAEWASRES